MPVGGWYLTVMSPPSWSAMNAAMSSGSSHVTPNSGVISAAVSGVGCTARRASTLRANRASVAAAAMASSSLPTTSPAR